MALLLACSSAGMPCAIVPAAAALFAPRSELEETFCHAPARPHARLTRLMCCAQSFQPPRAQPLRTRAPTAHAAVPVHLACAQLTDRRPPTPRRPTASTHPPAAAGHVLGAHGRRRGRDAGHGVLERQPYPQPAALQDHDHQDCGLRLWRRLGPRHRPGRPHGAHWRVHRVQHHVRQLLRQRLDQPLVVAVGAVPRGGGRDGRRVVALRLRGGGAPPRAAHLRHLGGAPRGLRAPRIHLCRRQRRPLRAPSLPPECWRTTKHSRT